jgi:prolyl oligopeptidase
VATFHAAKFVARLQEATKGKSAVLLRMDFDAGHGMGSTRNQRDALVADIYSFTLWCAGATGSLIPKQSAAGKGR